MKDNPFAQVRKHSRRVSSGKIVSVRKHNRTLSNSPFPNKTSGLLHLPVRTGIIVPSTKDTDKPVSEKEFQTRINETRKFLSDTNGGYTSIRAIGGFTDDKGNVVKEDVVVVESFSTKENFVKNRPKVRQFLVRKGKEWKQQSMGYEHEDDLYYIESKKN